MPKMNRAIIAAGLLASLAIGTPAAARNYNVLVFGNYVGANSAVGGALAAGGSILLSNYSVGSALSSEDDGSFTLLAGNAIGFRGGALAHGNAGAQGFLGNFTVAGGSKIVATPLDFSQSHAFYQHLSSEAAAYKANGIATSSGGILSLAGSSTGLNVFDVAGSDFAALNSLVLSVPTNAYALINITGGAAAFRKTAFTVNGTSAPNILFNFAGGSALSLDGVNFVGSLLAPDADVRFDSGQFDGQLVARSVIGSGAFSDVAINGYGFFSEFGGPAAATAAPEPGTWMMLIAGFGVVGAMLRRKLGRGPSGTALPLPAIA